jgi:hypothetical protein
MWMVFKFKSTEISQDRGSSSNGILGSYFSSRYLFPDQWVSSSRSAATMNWYHSYFFMAWFSQLSLAATSLLLIYVVGLYVLSSLRITNVNDGTGYHQPCTSIPNKLSNHNQPLRQIKKINSSKRRIWLQNWARHRLSFIKTPFGVCCRFLLLYVPSKSSRNVKICMKKKKKTLTPIPSLLLLFFFLKSHLKIFRSCLWTLFW